LSKDSSDVGDHIIARVLQFRERIGRWVRAGVANEQLPRKGLFAAGDYHDWPNVTAPVSYRFWHDWIHKDRHFVEEVAEDFQHRCKRLSLLEI
jgi:hypothetical protein